MQFARRIAMPPSTTLCSTARAQAEFCPAMSCLRHEYGESARRQCPPRSDSRQWRWSNRVDHAPMLPLFGILRRKRLDDGGHLPSLPGKVRTDDVPPIAPVGGLEQDVRTEKQNVRICFREEQRHGSDESKFTAERFGANVLNVTVTQLKRVALPPKMMSGFKGSGAT